MVTVNLLLSYKVYLVMQAIPPPMIIYNHTTLYTTWTKNINAIYAANTSSGYTNDNLTYQQLIKVFDHHIRMKVAGNYSLVI